MIEFLDLKKINSGYQKEILIAIDEVVKSGWYLKGDKVLLFEKEFS